MVTLEKRYPHMLAKGQKIKIFYPNIKRDYDFDRFFNERRSTDSEKGDSLI
jgi:hypothetical protein